MSPVHNPLGIKLGVDLIKCFLFDDEHAAIYDSFLGSSIMFVLDTERKKI